MKGIAVKKIFLLVCLVCILFAGCEQNEVELDIKFPCGYEYHIDAKGYTMKFPSICPLHGKECEPSDTLAEDVVNEAIPEE